MSKDVEVMNDNPNGKQLALREHGAVPALQTELSAGDIKARLDKITEVQREAMTPGVDFGTIPGTSGPDGKSRPTLLKPGAEKLCVLFRLDLQFTGPGNTETYHAPNAKGIEHLTVMRYCTVFSQVSGERLGGASAMCSSRESKYRWRKAARECPTCGKGPVLRSKFADRETGDLGWYCFQKKGGCGANFESGDKRITSQTEGRQENEDVADQFNTIIRMAEKRAMTAAVRLVTGASAIFDEEMPDGDETGGSDTKKTTDTGAGAGADASKDAGAGSGATDEKKGSKGRKKKTSEPTAGTVTNGNGEAVGEVELKVLNGLFEQVKFDSPENKDWYRQTICKQFGIPGPTFKGIKKAQFELACKILKNKLGAQGAAAPADA